MRPPNLKESMFKNRSVMLKVVPDPKPECPVNENRPRIDFTEVYDQTVHHAAKLMATYILADTTRKIAIHIAESKIR